MGFRQGGREVRVHRRVMMKAHKKSKWCSRSAYLCKNPKHYKWNYDVDDIGNKDVLVGELWSPPTSYVRGFNGLSDEEALQKVVERAFLSGDRTCYKALCILAFNNPTYFQWQKSCLANYERIVNSPIPNRKLKRQI
jgi:hypothetical protein